MNPVEWVRDQIDRRARAREYDCVVKCAALLGQDAGEEMYYLAHEDDPVPKVPDGSMWMRWAPDMETRQRDQAMLFNAQMSFAIGRAEGYQEAFRVDVMDKAMRALRDAA